MKATDVVPDRYQEVFRLDLKQNVRLAIGLNLAGIPLFLIFGWFFVQLANLLRVDSILLRGSMDFDILGLLALMGTLILVIVIHEWFHGLFFQFFTKSKPVYALKSLYAYAAAPGWFIPRNQYLIIGLAPLIGISITGIALIPFLPIHWLAILLFFLAMNAAGAVGDLYVTYKILQYPPDAMIRDDGDAFSLYMRVC